MIVNIMFCTVTQLNIYSDFEPQIVQDIVSEKTKLINSFDLSRVVGIV